MDTMLREIVASFRGTRSLNPIWICARQSKFDFRPGFKKVFLASLFKQWAQYIEEGYVVVVPVVFYLCSAEEPDKVINHPTEEDIKSGDFIVENHYNILLSFLDSKNRLCVERYEPANTLLQGDLNLRMERLIRNTMSSYSGYKLQYSLVHPHGLQSKYYDNTLCGHHILYWIIFRLKYGKEKAIELIENKLDRGTKFAQFCECLLSFKETCMIDI